MLQDQFIRDNIRRFMGNSNVVRTVCRHDFDREKLLEMWRGAKSLEWCDRLFVSIEEVVDQAVLLAREHVEDLRSKYSDLFGEPEMSFEDGSSVYRVRNDSQAFFAGVESKTWLHINWANHGAKGDVGDYEFFILVDRNFQPDIAMYGVKTGSTTDLNREPYTIDLKIMGYNDALRDKAFDEKISAICDRFEIFPLPDNMRHAHYYREFADITDDPCPSF